MSKPDYARNGYKFYSVRTPKFFLEYELPIDDARMTVQHRRQLERLEDAANIHHAQIEASPYRRG